MYLKKYIVMLNQKKLKITFLNPPHADWSLANNMTYLMLQSYYNRFGKYSENITWLEAPYKWDQYEGFDQIWEEIKEADMILFSSYVWNYTLIDDICSFVKQKNNKIITVIGGPHIGTNDIELLIKRQELYDYICQPTKPGEPFIRDLIDSWIEDGIPKHEKISWEINSEIGESYDLSKENYSVYEDHADYLKRMIQYAEGNKLEPFMVLETTRGCPYKCVFCEWGGGIGTKIYKKDLDIVKRDILTLKEIGYRDAYLTDANFGAFEDRDIEIFAFAWKNDFVLTDISMVKAKNLDRRKRLIDKWFEIVGPVSYNKKDNSENMWESTAFSSIVPTVSIQSISDKAMKIADRVDLSTEDKLELSRYIGEKCSQFGYPIPSLELILGMPGSTKQDFYNEMEIIWNFKAWSSSAHDYMFLPDSRLNSKDYKEQYQIETVEVYSDIVDEDGIDNWNGFYKNKITNFHTIRSCFSFSEDDMKEMWFMNNAAKYILRNFYEMFDQYTPAEFVEKAYYIIKELDDFIPIKNEIDDIFNPNTPARSIRQINGKFRIDAIEEMLEKNKLIIISELYNG